MDKEVIKSILKKSHLYAFENNFSGYSLYDSHNSFIPFNKFGKTFSFYINQINKRSPLNLRPLLGIKKGYNPKGIGLFLYIYSNIEEYNILNKNEQKRLCEYFFNWLCENSSPGFKNKCWGYNYEWPSRDGSVVPKPNRTWV